MQPIRPAPRRLFGPRSRPGLTPMTPMTPTRSIGIWPTPIVRSMDAPWHRKGAMALFVWTSRRADIGTPAVCRMSHRRGMQGQPRILMESHRWRPHAMPTCGRRYARGGVARLHIAVLKLQAMARLDLPRPSPGGPDRKEPRGLPTASPEVASLSMRVEALEGSAAG